MGIDYSFNFESKLKTARAVNPTEFENPKDEDWNEKGYFFIQKLYC